MPTLDLNFGDVGKVPDEGVWRILINKVIYKPNKAKDGFILDVEAVFKDMDDPAFEDFKLFPRPTISLKTSARWKLQEFLNAVTQEDWSDDGMQLEVDEDTNEVHSLAGKTVLAICVHEEYNKQVNCKPDTWLADDGTTPIGKAIAGEGALNTV